MMVLAQENFTKSLEDDEVKIKDSMDRCQVINNLIVKKSFKLDCYGNYHHYGPTTKNSKITSSLKIANYNLLHPGTSKTMFKDYALVAKIMNRYDIVSGLELLATVGKDELNNKAVLAYLKNIPTIVADLRAEIKNASDKSQIQSLNSEIEKILATIPKAQALYRAPGYLKVLLELKKLDPSWSLLLAPRGDSALVGSVEELVGYYYRADVTSPVANPHCKEYSDELSGTPYACFITLTKDFMGKDLIQHFARRPFMASFKAGDDKVTLVTSHVVFTYSGDEEAEKDMMKKSFGVESYKDLGNGINSVNFARYAEVKITLDFMNKYKTRYKDDKIMFLSDTNLVSNNAFWAQVLKSFPGAELFVTQASTISPPRYRSDETETEGAANDYDHFIFNPETFSGCSKGEVYNYFKSPIYKDIENKYIIREEVVGYRNKQFLGLNDGILPKIEFNITKTEPILEGDIPPTDDPDTIELEYPLTPAGQSKMDKFVDQFGKQLNQIYTVKKNEIVKDDYQLADKLEGLKRRVFLRQLTNPYYHRYMQEVLSDHFPASITCKF
jgi:hypothetical protein